MNENEQLLFEAVAQGKKSVAIKLLSQSIPLDLDALNGKLLQTPLMKACELEQVDMVRLLLEKGANPNVNGFGRCQALHFAAQTGNTAIINALLTAGADINAQNMGEFTPLMKAVESGHTDAVRLLLEHGADTEIGGNKDKSALIYAIANQRTDCVALLLAHYADPDRMDEDGMAPIDVAIQHRQIETVRLLVEYGADLKDRFNQLTAHAWRAESKEIVDYLRQVEQNPIAFQTKAAPRMMHQITAHNGPDFKRFVKLNRVTIQKLILLGQLIPLFEQASYDKQKILYPAVYEQINPKERPLIENIIRQTAGRERTTL